MKKERRGQQKIIPPSEGIKNRKHRVSGQEKIELDESSNNVIFRVPFPYIKVGSKHFTK